MTQFVASFLFNDHEDKFHLAKYYESLMIQHCSTFDNIVINFKTTNDLHYI